MEYIHWISMIVLQLVWTINFTFLRFDPIFDNNIKFAKVYKVKANSKKSLGTSFVPEFVVLGSKTTTPHIFDLPLIYFREILYRNSTQIKFILAILVCLWTTPQYFLLYEFPRTSNAPFMKRRWAALRVFIDIEGYIKIYEGRLAKMIKFPFRTEFYDKLFAKHMSEKLVVRPLYRSCEKLEEKEEFNIVSIWGWTAGLGQDYFFLFFSRFVKENSNYRGKWYLLRNQKYNYQINISNISKS